MACDLLARLRVIDGRLPSNGRTTIRLAEGAYTLTSYQRTCDGNCGTVDPASDSCSGSFTVSGDKPLSATVRVTFGSGCRIAFAASAE